MSSARSSNLNKAIVLVILMITMTQVGYLDSMNPWTNGEETLDETTDVLETGGSGSSGGNGTVWQVADIRSGGSSMPGFYGMEILVGDTIYFSADDGNSGHELWAHDTSNHSTWRVANIRSG